MGIQSENLAEDLYHLLLRCSSQRDPYSLCGQIVTELHEYIPYEQARILFFDISGKINGSLLYGVSRRIWENFMDYYKQDLSVSSYSLKKPLQISEKEKISVCDWTDQSGRQKDFPLFARDYVRPLKLTYCLGIGLSDQNNCIRAIIVLDRTRKTPFSEDEIKLIQKLRPLLENYFIGLLLPAPEEFSAMSFLGAQFHLTKREQEVVSLLNESLSTADLGSRLNISIGTVYKHIAHIYEKCGISSRQELYRLFQTAKSPV